MNFLTDQTEPVSLGRHIFAMLCAAFIVSLMPGLLLAGYDLSLGTDPKLDLQADLPMVMTGSVILMFMWLLPGGCIVLPLAWIFLRHKGQMRWLDSILLATVGIAIWIQFWLLISTRNLFSGFLFILILSIMIGSIFGTIYWPFMLVGRRPKTSNDIRTDE